MNNSTRTKMLIARAAELPSAFASDRGERESLSGAQRRADDPFNGNSYAYMCYVSQTVLIVRLLMGDSPENGLGKPARPLS